MIWLITVVVVVVFIIALYFGGYEVKDAIGLSGIIGTIFLSGSNVIESRKTGKAIEEIKYDHGKRLKDYEIYTSQKHKYLARFYKKAVCAQNNIKSVLSPMKTIPFIEDFSDEAIHECLEQLEFPVSIREKVLNKFRLSKREGQKEFTYWYLRKKAVDARGLTLEAYGELSKLALYIDAELKNRSVTWISDVHELIDDEIREQQLQRSGISTDKLSERQERMKKLSEKFEEEILPDLKSELLSENKREE